MRNFAPMGMAIGSLLIYAAGDNQAIAEAGGILGGFSILWQVLSEIRRWKEYHPKIEIKWEFLQIEDLSSMKTHSGVPGVFIEATYLRGSLPAILRNPIVYYNNGNNRRKVYLWSDDVFPKNAYPTPAMVPGSTLFFSLGDEPYFKANEWRDDYIAGVRMEDQRGKYHYSDDLPKEFRKRWHHFLPGQSKKYK